MVQVLRYPRLDTMLMVEAFIREHDGEFKKRPLWERLPKKMMYQTFSVIIDYLLGSKISIDAEGKIGWIYYPATAREYHGRKDLSVEQSLTSENLRVWSAKRDKTQQTKQKHETSIKHPVRGRQSQTGLPRSPTWRR